MHMIARVAAVASLVAFPLLAVAGGACNTGNIQCCNDFEEANSPAGLALLGPSMGLSRRRAARGRPRLPNRGYDTAGATPIGSGETPSL
ncbi:hypothetical protein LXA43DRAFT_1098102 [Ganoderma leucocontextum]|nr:hypothetical protein LXA43DRAFT_1098102 [Ganoderma leucocontextum]